MAADIKALRSRMKSVDSTLHLTKAMGLVASSKIRRARNNMNKSNQYQKSVEEVISLLESSPECKKSPFMRKSSPDSPIRLIVIAGDRGLAGGYNANIFRLLKEYPGAEIIPIGKRACERFRKETISSEVFTVSDAHKTAENLCRDFADGKFGRLGIVGTKYVSMLTQEAYIKWVLPLEAKTEKISGAVFEPDEITVLNAAVSEYLTGVIVSAVRESFAAEVAARKMAMDSAGKNAQQMIDDLQISYNRARQGAITQEITEIVAGSNA